MNPIIFSAVAQLIIALVKFAEVYLTSEKSGPQKFSLVTGTLKALFGLAKAITTGGAAETVAKIEPAIEPMVNMTASILFPSKEN